MQSPTFHNEEEARQWALKVTLDAKRFAATNDLWCYTVVRVDSIVHNVLYTDSVYAESRVDIERFYGDEIERLKQVGVPYYLTNNFSLNKGFEYNELLEKLHYMQ